MLFLDLAVFFFRIKELCGTGGAENYVLGSAAGGIQQR